jgi:hypothetical protein
LDWVILGGLMGVRLLCSKKRGIVPICSMRLEQYKT